MNIYFDAVLEFICTGCGAYYYRVSSQKVVVL